MKAGGEAQVVADVVTDVPAVDVGRLCVVNEEVEGELKA